MSQKPRSFCDYYLKKSFSSESVGEESKLSVLFFPGLPMSVYGDSTDNTVIVYFFKTSGLSIN